jgi:uncharacterized protein DUF6000
MHLDERLSANRAARFLAPGGPWQHSAMNKRDPAEQHRMVARLCIFASECMRDTTDDGDTPGDQA